MTLEEALAMMPPLLEAIERSILEHVATEAVAEGFNPAAVNFVVDEYARVLAASRARRLETARAMLEAGVTRLQ